MNLRQPARLVAAPLTAVAASAAVLALTVSTATASGLWCGGGRGLTAESAIQGAIDDARTSASGAGLFDCELVGEPEVFETFDDPYFGHVFRAQVNMACS